MPELRADAEIDEVAGSLDGLMLSAEQTFATVGERLGEMLGDFAALTSTFEALPAALETSAARDASDRLSTVSRDVSSMCAAMVRERRAFDEFGRLSAEAASFSSRLHADIRVLSILTFNAKTEAALLDRRGDDLVAFAEQMAAIAARARAAADESQAGHREVDRVLDGAWREQDEFVSSCRGRPCGGCRQGPSAARPGASSNRDFVCAAQVERQVDCGGKLLSVSRELDAAFRAIDVRRREGLAAASGFSERSRKIAGAIGAAIMALQIADSTRQRVEHVKEALSTTLAEANPRFGAESPEPWTERLSEASRRSALALVCRLQAAQLEGAARDFDDGLHGLCASFEQLAAECRAMARESERLYGAGDGVSDSFLDALRKKLEAAGALVHERVSARAAVDRAAADAARAMSRSLERASDLSALVGDNIFNGMNATLKARRFLSKGRAFSVIAEQLRDCAEGVASHAGALISIQEKIVSLAKGVEARGGDRLERFGEELAEAFAVLDRCAHGLRDALASLSREGERVGRILDEDQVRIGAQDEICAILSECSRKLEEIADAYPAPAENLVCLAPLLQKLRKRYTMASEREIFDSFPELVAICEFEAQNPGLPHEAEELDDMMLA